MNIQTIVNLAKAKSARKWLWLALFSCLIGIFLVFSSEVIEANAGEPELIGVIDRNALVFLSSLRTHALNSVAVDVTALGSGTVLVILISIVSLYLFFLKRTAHAFLLWATGGLAAAATFFLKSYFERSRPEVSLRIAQVEGFSYPSGHSLSSAALYMMLAFIFSHVLHSNRHKLLVFGFFVFLILAIGISRMYLGVHYFSDVSAGILLGTAITSLLWAVSLFLNIGHSNHEP